MSFKCEGNRVLQFILVGARIFHYAVVTSTVFLNYYRLNNEANMFLLICFQVKYCVDLGIPEEKAAQLFLFLGAFMTTGRLGVTALLAFKKFKVIYLYQGSIFMMGVSMLSLALVKTYTFFVLFAIVFGAFDGIFAATYHVQMMTCVEPAKRPSVIGFAHFVQTGFVAGGPPFSGKESDVFILFMLMGVTHYSF